MLYLFAIALPLLVQASGAPPELHTMRHFTTDNGLSQNLVFDMHQDHQGFIWIGTKDGLNRYDGYNFRIYRSDPSDSLSLSSNYITYIREDDNNRLWVETRPGGLHKYDPEQDNFTVINQAYAIPPVFEDAIVQDLYGSRKTGWWVATSSGLFYLDHEKKEVSQVPVNGSTEPVTVRVIIPDRYNNSVIIGINGKGFYASDLPPEPDKWEEVGFLNMHFQPEKTIDHLIETSDGNWLMVQESTIREISADGKLISRFDTAENRNPEFPLIVSIEPADDQTYWMVQNSDLIKVDVEHQRMETLMNIDYVHSLLVDRSAVVWAGTSGYGLYSFDQKSSRLGYRTETFFEWPAPDFAEKIEARYELGYKPSDYNIYTIIPESDQRFWILTLSAGLFRYDTATGEMERHIVELPSLGEEIYHAFWADKDENGVFTLLFIDWVVRYHPEEGIQEYWSILDFFPDIRLSSGAPLYDPFTVIMKHKDYYWVGSSEMGLSAYNPEKDTLKRFMYEPENEQSLSSNHILSLLADPSRPERYIWAGTDGGGLNRIDLETGDVLRVTERNGLPNNVIYAIYPDESGNLWMSSNKGIFRMNPETQETLNFVKSDGLQSNEFNRRQHMKMNDGRLKFCGIGGCNLFDPGEMTMNEVVPTTVITGVSVMNEDVLPLGSGWFSTETDEPVLNVEWRQNIIGFEFASLDYSAPDKNTYRYRFPPFVEEWTDIGNRREITFTNLDPGRYLLEVIGSNNDGIKSKKPAVMHVMVSPPFWMTSWFRTLAITLFSALIAGIVLFISKRRYRAKLQQLKYKMAVDAERLRISRDMHDDLGSRLTQIRMMSQFAEADSSTSETAKNTFSDISDEVEDVIYNLSEIVWSLNPENDTLDNLAGFMVQYCENFCKKVKLTCRIDADVSFSLRTIAADVRHNVISVLKESLNNAARHSGCSEIRMKLILENGRFIAEISDNGCGFDTQNCTPETGGNGTRYMKQRMVNAGGTLEIDSSEGQGTTVRFSIPAG